MSTKLEAAQRDYRTSHRDSVYGVHPGASARLGYALLDAGHKEAGSTFLVEAAGDAVQGPTSERS